MGLDTVELIMAVEDGFQIHIENEEAERLYTLGNMLDLVVSKIRGNSTNRCRTSMAFYRTRRGLIEAVGAARREIRPSTELRALLPKANRREQWQHRQAAMKVKLPDLRYPGWFVLGFLGTGVALGLAGGIYAHSGFQETALLTVVGLVLFGGALGLSPGFATALPSGDVTVGDLARDVLALNHAWFVSRAGGWNEHEIWESLCRIIVDQTGVKRDIVTREASFVDDLRLE